MKHLVISAALIALPLSAQAGPDELFDELEQMEHGQTPAAELETTPETASEPELEPGIYPPDPEAVEAILEFAHEVERSAERSREHRERIRRHAEAARAHHREDHRSFAIAEDAPAAAVHDDGAAEKNKAAAERFAVGLEGHTAANIAVNGEQTRVTAIGTGGLWASFTIGSFLSVGLNHLGVELDDEGADRGIVQGGPFAQVFFFPWRSLQLYGEAGVPVQVEARERDFGDDGEADLVGAAIYTGAGARLWLGAHVTLGASVRAYRVVHGTFRMPPKDLALGREAVMAGTSFGLHF